PRHGLGTHRAGPGRHPARGTDARGPEAVRQGGDRDRQQDLRRSHPGGADVGPADRGGRRWLGNRWHGIRPRRVRGAAREERDVGEFPPVMRAGSPSTLHFRLSEGSSVPPVWRNPPAFTIVRLESLTGLAAPIKKVSALPALLVSIPIKPLASEQYRVW